MAEFTAARTGVYYIVVGGGGANFATQAGHYTLSVAEAVDPGATRATAQAITIGTPVKGFIGFGSDTIDMYALTVASNGTLQINLAGTAADTDIKTSLLDSAGSPVVGNTVKPGQTYYVKVDASGGRLSQSPYTLALTFDAAPPGHHLRRSVQSEHDLPGQIVLAGRVRGGGP